MTTNNISPTVNPVCFDGIPVSKMCQGDLVDYLFGVQLTVEKREEIQKLSIQELQKLAEEKRSQEKK